jgi:glycosyltransferase involved in cell wall biosynthesis/GT2 family glycosyltransferase
VSAQAKQKVKVAVASGSEEVTARFIMRVREVMPELPLYVISEFPPSDGNWIPYHLRRSLAENYARSRGILQGKEVQYAAALFESPKPYGRLRILGLLLAPLHFAAFDEKLDPIGAGYWLRRLKSWAYTQTHRGGDLYTFAWRVKHPSHFRRPVRYFLAKQSGRAATLLKMLLPAKSDPPEETGLPEGIAVVVPSRDGKKLLGRLLPGLLRELEGTPSEVIVVNNGSRDGTAGFLRSRFEKVVVEDSVEPLSFAAAVNRGIRRARFSHVCLLNNDMVLEQGFFKELRRPFDIVPNLFCATAQILFPPGKRREETGKAALPARELGSRATDFPVRCEMPAEGEDLSYVLYGSGGCSLYSTAKLRSLGAMDEAYTPAYCEDLDIGYRAWLRGFPTVFCAGATVVHFHRATTSRFYTEEELGLVLDVNYIRFLVRAVASPSAFRRLWKENIWRLNVAGAGHFPSFPRIAALGFAVRALRWIRRPPPHPQREELILALCSGDVAVFPGRRMRRRPVVLVASPYIPYPLSHGGAVRVFNLMRRAAEHFDLVLVACAGELGTPPPELLDICSEVVMVRRVGSHLRPTTDRPDVVEEFDLPAFRGALRQTVRKWRPFAAQLELTQMAMYAADCAPAKTILVEHDITFDLHEQLIAQGEDWELRRQYFRWLRFEKDAWRRVDAVVVMSERDRRAVQGARCVTIPNGVDIERFRPSAAEPEAARLLFIGSFAHLPNVMAVDFFLREVWPLLAPAAPKLHIIAGVRHQYFLDRYRDRVAVHLEQPGLEVEDFVADVRPAYERAQIVIAPLLASAGTNIKIVEAMAMGKAIVSTPGGVNGLDVEPGADVTVTSTAAEMAAAILELISDTEKRRALEREARATAERRFDWDAIAAQQERLYRELLGD